jgi:hypothetical protein
MGDIVGSANIARRLAGVAAAEGFVDLMKGSASAVDPSLHRELYHAAWACSSELSLASIRRPLPDQVGGAKPQLNQSFGGVVNRLRRISILETLIFLLWLLIG